MAIQIISVYQKKGAAAYSNAFPYYSLIWGKQLPEFNVTDNLSCKEFDKKGTNQLVIIRKISKSLSAG